MFEEANVQVEPDPLLSGERPTILVIDDDAAQASVLQWQLQSLGYDVLHSAAGRSGLLLAQSERPDAVLLDLQLPDVSGLEVCSQLCDGSATSEIPIIIVSGADEDDVVRQARRRGCEYYLRKPYDPNVLLMLIERVLSAP